ncbi:MAG: CRISPR-associated endonuclease Cas3'' [Dehalococcoidia bacterium]|nr:CRISPR-associated endonuclease Cas3'' [Dehalococcoidia bacterium]
MDASAHSRNEAQQRHPLVAHLRDVGELAAEFAVVLGAAELARAAGIYHDLGKFHPDFQAYLDACDREPGRRHPRVDHKGAGATYAAPLSPLLPLLIQAHHGGLKSNADLRTWLAKPDMKRRIDEALALARVALPQLQDAPVAIPLPKNITTAPDAEMFVRMVFSCLVDADFLDTEAHFNSSRAAERETAFDAAVMLEKLRAHRASLNARNPGPLSRLRETIAERCEVAGERPPAIYRMTVPTGGGKTLAGMAFALRHAAVHGKRRVVVAIPYTSITEQTAAVYRDIFGECAVLEHSSAAMWDEDGEGDATGAHAWQRLAAENWDAPIVVTTTVQLFESLLGNRTSTSRKLHNLAGAVLILDEVQMLPAKYIAPILDVLRGLVDHCGTTVLLSTATQPRFGHPEFASPDEIAPDPAATFALLERVRYTFAPEPWSWPDAAAALRERRQALMVLNTKKDALAVIDALDDENALHLSTLLCGAHRADVLTEVKRRLAAGEECRLVTTQVIEAGVDIDFPAVFRAMGPLDRILQAAGRCNREGKDDVGEVTVFLPLEGGLPPGTYEMATQLTRKHLASGAAGLQRPDAVGAYFAELYERIDPDADRIQEKRARMDFPEVRRAFRMIVDDTEDVIVPYGDDAARATVAGAVAGLRQRNGQGRELLRSLQPYTVAVRHGDIERAAGRGWLVPVTDGVREWVGDPHAYDCRLGLQLADQEVLLT